MFNYNFFEFNDLQTVINDIYGEGYTAGLVFRLTNTDSCLQMGSFIIRLNYLDSKAKRTINGQDYIKEILISPHRSAREKSITNYEVTIGQKFIHTDLLYKFNLIKDEFSFFLGPNIKYLIGSSIQKQWRIVSPDTTFFQENLEGYNYNNYKYKFSDDKRIISINEAPIITHKRWQISMKAGISYDLQLSRFLLSPYIYAEIPLSKADIHYHWYTYYLSGGIDLLIRL